MCIFSREQVTVENNVTTHLVCESLAEWWLEPPPAHSSWCSRIWVIGMSKWQLTQATLGESAFFCGYKK